MNRRILLAGVLAILCIPGLAAAFGTVYLLGQNGEHERITRAGLAGYGFGLATMDQIAGRRGSFGAVGAPDNPVRGLMSLKAAHCDGADTLPPPLPPEQERAARTILVEHAAEVRELTTRLSASAGLSPRLKTAEDRIRQLERNDAYRRACAQAENASRALAQAHRDSDEQRTRIAHLADENARLADSVAGLEAALKSLATECEAAEWMLREHLAAVMASQADTGDTEAAIFLCGRRIAYVGGRTGLIPHFRALVERSGGSLLHHDGGMEEQSSRLDGLLAQCDAVLCPIDCVSHDASMRAKRACKQRAMPFVCLRTSSLSSFAEGLRQLSQNSGIAIRDVE